MSARKRKLVLTRRARQDLKSILLYSQVRGGDEQRRAYKQDLDQALQNLVEFPELGRVRDELGSGLRSLPVRLHNVFYRETSDGIRVVRILHGKMSLEGQFNE